MNIAPPPFVVFSTDTYKVDRILDVSYFSLNTGLKVKNQNYTLQNKNS